MTIYRGETMAEKENNPEDSMDGFDEPVQETRLVTYRKGFDRVDDMLSQMINLDSNNVVHEPTCPICSSPLRQEAEDLYSANPRTTVDVSSLMRNKANIKISAEVVTNHMKNHSGGVAREIQKVEYVNRIRSLYGQNASTLDRIELCLAVITERLMQINSILPAGEVSAVDVEKIKSDQTVKLMNSYNSILKLQATILGEMKDSGEIITISRQKFVSIFNEAITGARTDREREVILSILNGLKSG